jgi:predicted nucleic acid-binding protein
MRSVIVDASVAIKWFIPEVHSIAAVRLLESDASLAAPDLILAELGNVLWKKVRRGEIAPDEASQIFKGVAKTGIEIIRSDALLPSALELALALDRPVYDCLYLSLAVARDCALVTADRKFQDAVSASAFAPHILWVEDAS